ncbi:MAG: mandelate racemase/muconate lactonizing enzyme family protein [Candidatus Latescibacteria bacterium]|nr:mandelate racemase/muconate lactonizing enzyme family protein [Candidatus Latescibacterota bacterium]
MQVSKLDIAVHRSAPRQRPVRDALQSLPGSGSVKVTVHTDTGVSGTGEAFFGRIAGGPAALGAFIEHVLEPVVVGRDPALVRGLHGAMLRETEYHGSAGLAMFGIAAVDTALWDCLGRAQGVPCWRLWGGVHERIPAYAMVGWLNYSDEEVQRICTEAVEQGFKAVKIKVGFPTLAEDVRRVEAVQQAVGADIRVMVDANQSLTTAQALVRGRAFQELGCYWWEEPIAAADIDGYAELAAALDMPVATGENLYSPADFARFLKRDAVDIVQPDLRRGGGPTALLDIGALAGAFGRPYASHGGGPVQLNIMACLANALYLETGLIGPDSPLRLEDGCVSLPQGPGFAWA